MKRTVFRKQTFVGLCVWVSLSVSGVPGVSAQEVYGNYEVLLAFAERESETVTVGDTVVLDVSVRNNSDLPINIVRPLDGSHFGSRYPVYTSSIEKPLPIRELPEMPWCGFTNPLLPEDFISIDPGETAGPFQWFAFVPKIAGRYEVSVLIKHEAENEEFMGSMDLENIPQELLELLARVPRMDVQSPVLTLDVLSNGLTLDPNYHCLMGMPRAELDRLWGGYNGLSEHTDRPGFYTPSIRGTSVVVHVDENDIVDGAEFVSQHVESNELYLQWLRGDATDIPQRSVTLPREDEWQSYDKTVLYVGTLAEPSSLVQTSSVTWATTYR